MRGPTALLLARGFTLDMMVGLVRGGDGRADVAAGRAVETTKVRIQRSGGGR